MIHHEKYVILCFVAFLSDIAFSKFNFDYSIFIWIFEKYFIYCRISCPFFSLSNFNLHKLSQLGLCQGYPLLLRMVKLHFDSDNIPSICSFKQLIMHEFHRDINFQKSEIINHFFTCLSIRGELPFCPCLRNVPDCFIYTQSLTVYIWSFLFVSIFLYIHLSVFLFLYLSIYLGTLWNVYLSAFLKTNTCIFYYLHCIYRNYSCSL